MSSSTLFFADGAGNLHHTYNRKQRSLGVLCSKFLELYNRDDVRSVGLDDAAKNLGVERRRIYDIVNVLESIGVLARKGKNQYNWIGFSGISRALENIKEKALIKEKSGTNVEAISSEYTRSLHKDREEEKECERSLVHNKEYGEERCSSLSSFTFQIESRREKSLATLTENFVKLFLATNVDMLTLDEAAKLLLGDHHEPSQTKTKVRRLYDIANVLSSLNLIEKTHHVETRKPAFRWLGLNGRNCLLTLAIPSNINNRYNNNNNNNKKRSFGMDISNMDLSKRNRLMATANMKSVQTQTNAEDVKTCNLTDHKQLQTKRHCFGPFSPVVASQREEICEEKNERVSHVEFWEDLATSYRPDYRNQALYDLFDHYIGAWKRWYGQIAQVSDSE